MLILLATSLQVTGLINSEAPYSHYYIIDFVFDMQDPEDDCMSTPSESLFRRMFPALISRYGSFVASNTCVWALRLDGVSGVQVYIARGEPTFKDVLHGCNLNLALSGTRLRTPLGSGIE